MHKTTIGNHGQPNGKTLHHVEIGMKKPEKKQVLTAKKMTLRNRLLSAIFGKGHRMVVLVPGESVGTISITEMEVTNLSRKPLDLKKDREEQGNE